jgi:hypothetical protein
MIGREVVLLEEARREVRVAEWMWSPKLMLINGTVGEGFHSGAFSVMVRASK